MRRCVGHFKGIECSYLNVLLVPGAYSHGVLRCSLYQVAISAILRSINNEELIQQTEEVGSGVFQKLHHFIVPREACPTAVQVDGNFSYFG